MKFTVTPLRGANFGSLQGPVAVPARSSLDSKLRNGG